MLNLIIYLAQNINNSNQKEEVRSELKVHFLLHKTVLIWMVLLASFPFACAQNMIW